MEYYYGSYQRVDTTAKKEGAKLLGADNLIGDVYEIVFNMQQGTRVAWIKNRFNDEVAFFDCKVSRQLSIFEARGWHLKAILSFVAYTDQPEGGMYWGEVLLVCYDPIHEEEFSKFIQCLAKKVAEGVRPDIELNDREAERIIESAGQWLPSKRVAMPDKKTGTVVMKSQRKLSEKLIEQGRKRNKGCYGASLVFMLIFIAAILFTLKSCGIL